MRLLNADGIQFFAWNRENETCEKRRKKVVLKTVHWFARCWMTSRKNCSRQSKSQKNERFCRKNSMF